MRNGHTRVSTTRRERSLDTQHEALIDAECDPDEPHSDTISDTQRSRPELTDAAGVHAHRRHRRGDPPSPSRMQYVRGRHHQR